MIERLPRSSRVRPLRLRVIAHALATAFAAPAMASPAGPVVVNGSASISNSGKTLTVNSTPGAILEWRSFSIGADEAVRFQQQSASSQVLNRVTGTDPTRIAGVLSSNGRVFLINPNGIAFAPGSQVNVAGLVASTLNLSNEDFLAGRLRFQEQPGAGKITSQGTIQTVNGGQIFLVAPSVENSGILIAPDGDVILAAGKMVSLVDAQNPEIAVEINAPQNAALNLGQIVARNVSILAGAIQNTGSINADAAVLGDGGRILLKATDSAQIAGSLSARGGEQGGNGGSIETSAKSVDIGAAKVDASAPKGKAGQWLIDPTDVVIDAAAAGTIAAALNTGTSTTVTTPDGSITVSSAISKTAGGDAALTMNAVTGIRINAAITSSSGKLDLNLNGGSGNTISNTVNLNGGTLNLGAASTLSSGTVAKATVASGNGAVLTATYGTLDDVILQTNLTVGSGATVYVPNRLTLDNALVSMSDSGYLYFNGSSGLLTTALDRGIGSGSGSVVNINPSGAYAYFWSPSGGLTIDPSISLPTSGYNVYNLGMNGVLKTPINVQSGTANIYGTNWQTQSTLGATGGTLMLNGTWNNPAGKTINIGSGATLNAYGSWTNAGVIAGASGSTLNIGGTYYYSSNTWSNSGTISARGATLNLNGSFTTAGIGNLDLDTASVVKVSGIWDNSATTLNAPYDISAAGHTGSFILSSGTIKGGVLSSSTGAPVQASYGTLDDVILQTNLLMPYGTVYVPNRLTLDNASVVMQGNGSLYFSGATGLLTTTLDRGIGSGTGSIVATSSNGSTPYTYTRSYTGGALTIDPSISLPASGYNDIYLGTNGVLKTPVNVQSGTTSISGTNWQTQSTLGATGGTLTLDGTWNNPSGKTINIGSGATLNVYGNWSNSGTISARGATLNLNGNFTTAGIGNLDLDPASVVKVTGIWDNSATTLNAPYDISAAGHTGSFILSSGTIKGGVLSSSAGAPVQASYGTLDDVILQTNLAMPYGTVYVPNRLTLDNASISMSGNGWLYFNSASGLLTTTLDRGIGSGTGGIVAAASGGNTHIYGYGVTIDSSISLPTSGYNTYDLGTNGVLKTPVNVQSGTTSISGTNWQTKSTLGATGGTLWLDGTWSNPSGKTINIGSGATLYAYGTWSNAGAITGGNNSTLNLNGTWRNTGSISAGANSLISLSNLPVNDGILDIGAGGTIRTNNADLSNSASGIIRGAGTLDLGYATTFQYSPSYQALERPYTLTNYGVIDPGAGANGTGTLTLRGNLVMQSGGKLHVDLGGTAAGQYDQLSVVNVNYCAYYANCSFTPSTATLNGALEIAEVGASRSGGFFADRGNAFPNMVTVNGGATGLAGSFTANTVLGASAADVGFVFAAGSAPGISNTSYSTTRWATDASGLWSGAANWTRGVPTAGKDAVISRAAPTVVTIDSAVATPLSLVDDNDLTLAAGGFLTLPSDFGSYAHTLTLAGGTLVNSSAVTLNGPLVLQSGSISGAGSLVIGAGGSMVKSTAGDVSINQAFSNTGTLSVNGGQLHLGGDGVHGGSFDVAAGATLDFSAGTQQFADGSSFGGAGSFIHSGGNTVLAGSGSGLSLNAGSSLDLAAFGFSGSGNLSNFGTVNDAGGIFSGRLLNSGIATLSGGATLSNGFVNTASGTLNLVSGNLTVAGADAVLAGGTLNLGSGASLTKSGGVLDWQGGSITGSGTLAFTNGGIIGFGGSGDRVLDNASLAFSFTNLTLPSGSLSLRSGSLNLDTTVDGATLIPAGATLALYGGSMSNNGPLNIAGRFGLYGGVLSGTGAINMTGGSIDMPTSSTVAWNASGALTNTGTLDLSNRTISSAMTNTGTINSTGGLVFTQAFTNAGVFNDVSGTVSFNGGYIQTGGFTTLGASVSAPASMVVGGSGFALNGGTLGGSGTITGNLSVGAGTLAPGFSPGSLSITGNLMLSAGSTTAIELGGLTPGSGYDVIHVSGSASLAGALNVSNYGGYVPAAGSSYNFLDYASVSGTFGSTTMPAGITMGKYAAYSQLYAGILPAAAIPATPSAASTAPATAAPVLLAATLLPPPVSTQQAQIAGMSVPTGANAGQPVTMAVSGISIGPGPAAGTATAGTFVTDASAAGSTAGYRVVPSWYLGGDGVSAWFPNLPLASLDRGELGTLLEERRAYKRDLLAGANTLLEQHPEIADLPLCREERESDSGECALNEKLQREILARHGAAAKAASRVRASLPAIARKRALVIGLNQYTDKRIPRLESALPDARAMQEVLASRLGYEVTLLENSGKAQIMAEFNRLALEMSPSDSFVVYFAGHGDMVEKTGEGYWIPSDASATDPRGWISNADVSRLLALVKARQVAMISDSCYSGTFAREASLDPGSTAERASAEAYLKKRAVTVMTSGADEPVADSGKEGHSVFAWNLLERIRHLDNWRSGASVYATIRTEVERELPQSPLYGASVSAGHQAGADFLFERREKEE